MPMVEGNGSLTVTETSLANYFTERVADAARQLRPPPLEDTCWYLGAMLDRFGRSERLFSWQDGHMTLRPLAQLYGDAIEARDERERCLLLQQLGDMALFLGAAFPQRFARRGIRKDYFVGMGGSAYDYLAGNARNGRHVFADIASAFDRLLGLIADVLTQDEDPGDADVLALYRRWLEDRDPHTARRLRALGIELQGADRTH